MQDWESLHKLGIGEYTQSGVFGFSTSGSMVTTVAANARYATTSDPDLKSSALWQLKLYAPKQEAMAHLTDLDSALPETQLVTDPDATMVLLPKFVPLLAGTEVLPCILGSATVGSARLIQVCKEQWGYNSIPFFGEQSGHGVVGCRRRAPRQFCHYLALRR